MFDALKDYQPQKISDGFEILKGTFDCTVNSARIEQYSGDRPEFQGVEFFRYELEIINEGNIGRRVWKSYNLNDEVQLKKLADQLFTLGFEFKSREELEKTAEEFVKINVKIRAWGWVREEGQEAIQLHIIKSRTDITTSDKVPF